MNTPSLNQKDALDRAIIACLRVFARRGREVRLQKEIVSEKPATVEMLPAIKLDSLKNVKEQE